MSNSNPKRQYRKFILRTCDHCHEEYFARADYSRKYCSSKCGAIARYGPSNYVDVQCKYCQKVFTVNASVQKYRKRAYCSPQCNGAANRSATGRVEVLRLAEGGRSAKEIAELLGLTVHQVYNKMSGSRFRFARGKGSSRSTFRRNWIRGKSCLICGFSRYVEIAHIVPHRDGGTMDDDNLIPLCPNHHRLFDSSRLTQEEARALRDTVPNYLEFAEGS